MNRPYGQAAFASGQDHATAPERRRHFDYFAARLPDPWASAAFGFGLSACLLAASAAGVRWGIIGFFGLTGLMALLYPHAVLRANVRNAWLWLYPAWTLFSTQWSVDADRTLHQVMLLLPTVAAGIALGGMPHRRAAGAGGALALASYIGYSVAYGASTLFSDTASGGEALMGITNGKNYFGHLSAMALLMAPLLLTFARGRWVVPAVGFTAVVLAMCGFALLQSHATGSTLSALIGFMVLGTVLLFRRISWQFRVVLAAGVLSVLILYVNFGQDLQDEIFATVLQKFHKDVSLTGRTVLWDYADRLITEHRMLGFGYGAFWYYTNPDAWTLWRMMGVQPMSGFNFHNTPRDILIDCGWVGLALYIASLGYALIRTVSRALMRGDLASGVGLAFITYFIVRMPVETTGLGSVTVDALLLIAFLCVPVKEEVPAGWDTPPPRRWTDAWRGDGKGEREVLAPTRTRFVPLQRR